MATEKEGCASLRVIWVLLARVGSVLCGEEESGISKSERNVHELLGMVALESLGKGDRELQCWGNGKMNRGRNGGC